MAECWEVIIDGVGNDFCSGCANINGTWTLYRNPAKTCPRELYDSPPTVPYYIGSCVSGDLTVGFAYSGGGLWVLSIGVAGFGTLATYHSESAFNCNDTNVFSLYSTDNGACGSFPATLTITPIDCPL
jgi:hypothetical protein